MSSMVSFKSVARLFQYSSTEFIVEKHCPAILMKATFPMFFHVSMLLEKIFSADLSCDINGRDVTWSNAVCRSQIGRIIIHKSCKDLDIAHHHHCRKAAVLGTLMVFCQLGCNEGKRQRDGGTNNNHSYLFPKAAFLGIHIDFRGPDDVEFDHVYCFFV